MDEDGLIIAARYGNEEAFSELLEQYNGFIFYYARKVHINGMALEDAVQELRIVFLNCIRTYDKSKGASFTAFLTVAFKRANFNMIRYSKSIKRFSEYGAQKVCASETLLGEESISRNIAENPEDYLLTDEMRHVLVRRMKAKLSELEEKCIILFAQGYTGKEISGKLSIDGKSVYNAIERARKKIGFEE